MTTAKKKTVRARSVASEKRRAQMHELDVAEANVLTTTVELRGADQRLKDNAIGRQELYTERLEIERRQGEALDRLSALRRVVDGEVGDQFYAQAVSAR